MFTVRFVSEDALPTGHSWVIGVAEGGDRFLFVKRGAVCSSTFEEVWEAAMLLNESAAPLRVAV
jgi:hypothetical protein